MLLDEANRVLDEYASWIRDSMRAVEEDNSVRIIGPMLDRDNDNMSVLMARTEDGGYVLTDLGEIVGALEMDGCSVRKGSRHDRLLQVLNGYGVSIEDDEIFVRCSRSELVPKMNMLFQAMASVDDLFFTSQDSVRNLFAEDVRNWMFDNGIRAVDGPSFPGKSGLMYKFDYAIPRSKNVPERLVKTVNVPKEQNIRNALFGWQDVEGARQDTEGYVILNAAQTKDGTVAENVLAACVSYGITPIQWGINQDEFVGRLAA